MSIAGRPRSGWEVGACVGVVCLAMLAIAGCGSNGDASVELPPKPKPEVLVKGVVSMPNGTLASTQSFWKWAMSGQLLPSAFAAIANPSVFPAPGVRVTLARVDH